MKSINPATGELLKEYQEHSDEEVKRILEECDTAFRRWRMTSFNERSALMSKAATVLRANKGRYARLMTEEMGKLLRESEAEVEKCALACDYYAQNAQEMLKDEEIATDASRSFASFEPLGVVLAVMPWNFPFWQVFRFAAPALMAGNVGVLKHASNTPGCALAIEEVFRDAEFPKDVFRTLLIGSSKVEAVIKNDIVKAVTLTGSEKAGSLVASAAARDIKKSVLELGGSDPFIVLEDADVEECAASAVTGRMINAGQSCIAAKRFIVVESVASEFEHLFAARMRSLKVGDPTSPASEVGPLARPEFVEEIDALVQDAVKHGAKVLCGGRRPALVGCYYEPTVVTKVTPQMRLYHEETFGPVATVLRVKDADEAVMVANATRFGLGASVWTKSKEKGLGLARRVEAGCVFVNGTVKSDPRLPFGGVKKSGFGRELGSYGIKEFVNVKTVWVR
jgi:succinate-semialdehyde dehydrogenase / glutarate-semialdehyde dehydrogenase